MLVSHEIFHVHVISRLTMSNLLLFVVYADDTSKEITHASQETASEEADTKRSKLLERDRDRRKVVSAAFEDLKESTIPEEDGEEDLEDMSINLSSTAMSSLSSFKNKFQFSFSGKNKVKIVDKIVRLLSFKER